MKKFSLVLCGIIALILIIPAAQATISNRAETNYVGAGEEIDVEVIQVSVDIRPETLSDNSKGGKWVTCYINITPSEDYDYTVHDIDPSSIFLSIFSETLPAITDFVGFIDIDSDGVCELMIKFERPIVLEMLSGSTGIVELTITGSFADGSTFFGVDTVNIAGFCL